VTALVKVPYWNKVVTTVGNQLFKTTVLAPDKAVDCLGGSFAARYYAAAGNSQYLTTRGLRSIVGLVAGTPYSGNWKELDPRSIVLLPPFPIGVTDSALWYYGAGDALAMTLEAVQASSDSIDIYCTAGAAFAKNYGFHIVGHLLYEVDTAASDPLSLIS